MQPQRPTADPLYIPADLLERYVDEARRRVIASRHAAGHTTPTPVLSPASTTQERRSQPATPAREPGTALLVATLGLVGWAALVGVWAWLAIRSGSPVWTAIAVLGGLALVPGIAGAGLLGSLTTRPGPQGVARAR